MSEAALEELLRDLESARSERTSSDSKTDKFGEAICAFANDLDNSGEAGYLFVGVHDDGQPSNTAITESLLQRLAALRSDGNLLPAPVISVSKRKLLGAWVAVVEVLPSELPPVRYKGTVWVRVGARRARATEADERRLSEKRASLARTWDARPCAAAREDDLMMSLFNSYYVDAVSSEVRAENHRSLQDQMSSLRFLDRRSQKPTNAALLLFGKDAEMFFRGAYLQYVRYQGTNAASELVRDRRYSGDLVSVLRELSSLARDLANSRPVSIGPLEEEVVYDYPMVAVREVLMNAVVHRDYESNTPIMINHFSDRIEIQNPGSLFGDIRPEDFPGVTAYRNPVLAEAARILGFVNRFGRGVPRTNAAMAENGSPPAIFAPSSRHFLVTLRKRS